MAERSHWWWYLTRWLSNCFAVPVSPERTEATSYWWIDWGLIGVIGKRGFHALFLCCGVENRPLEPLKFGFPLEEGNEIVAALGGIAPIGAFPVGASSLIVVGTTKGLILEGSKTLSIFWGAFFEKESPRLPSLTGRLNRERVQSEEFLSSWRLVSP